VHVLRIISLDRFPIKRSDSVALKLSSFFIRANNWWTNQWDFGHETWLLSLQCPLHWWPALIPWVSKANQVQVIW